jgi:hypothetical protein
VSVTILEEVLAMIAMRSTMTARCRATKRKVTITLTEVKDMEPLVVHVTVAL